MALGRKTKSKKEKLAATPKKTKKEGNSWNVVLLFGKSRSIGNKSFKLNVPQTITNKVLAGRLIADSSFSVSPL